MYQDSLTVIFLLFLLSLSHPLPPSLPLPTPLSLSRHHHHYHQGKLSKVRSLLHFSSLDVNICSQLSRIHPSLSQAFSGRTHHRPVPQAA